MKHQQVSVDFWAMARSMLSYGLLTILGWMLLRLFSTAFTLPRRIRLQQENIQATLAEFQRRYPDLNVTEDDLRNAEKELEEWTKEFDEKKNGEVKESEPDKSDTTSATPAVDDKKSN